MILIILAIIIVCATICYVADLIYHYKVNSPQYKCQHIMETQKTFSGDLSHEYLSTCTKCGYQKKHYFYGLNAS